MLTASPASAALIGFEGIVASNNATIQSSVVSGGYTFTATTGKVAIIGGNYVCSGTCANDGSTTLGFGAASGTNPMSGPPLVLTGPAPFNLLSFDYAEFTKDVSTNATQLTVVGNLLGGGTLSRIFTLDGIIDGIGCVDDFQSAVLDSVFATAALTSVNFSGFNAASQPRAFSLDNLVIRPAAPVPEPASWAMMISGFGLVGSMMRRRQRVAVRFA